MLNKSIRRFWQKRSYLVLQFSASCLRRAGRRSFNDVLNHDAFSECRRDVAVRWRKMRARRGERSLAHACCLAVNIAHWSHSAVNPLTKIAADRHYWRRAFAVSERPIRRVTSRVREAHAPRRIYPWNVQPYRGGGEFANSPPRIRSVRISSRGRRRGATRHVDPA